MNHSFPRGTMIRITSGIHAGKTGTVESRVFQKTIDYPEESADAFHIALDDDTKVTVRRDQVEERGQWRFGQA